MSDRMIEAATKFPWLRSGTGVEAKAGAFSWLVFGSTPLDLACRPVGCCQLAVGYAPYAGNAVASTDKQGGRGQRNKRQKQRVLDEVLALFVATKGLQCFHKLSLQLISFHVVTFGFADLKPADH